MHAVIKIAFYYYTTCIHIIYPTSVGLHIVWTSHILPAVDRGSKKQLVVQGYHRDVIDSRRF